MQPKIIGEDEVVGINNADLEKASEKVERYKMYQDLSTIMICPTRGVFPTRVVQSWMKLQRPMNQARLFSFCDSYPGPIHQMIECSM